MSARQGQLSSERLAEIDAEQRQINAEQIAKGAEENPVRLPPRAGSNGAADRQERNQHNGAETQLKSGADITGEQPITLADFYAYLPAHQYIFVPSGELWPGSSVDARLPPVSVPGGKPMLPSTWLDRRRAIEQMTWAPGLPPLIQNRLISHGGWINRDDVACLNLYRPPTIKAGDAAQAGPWLEHLKCIYPESAQHIAAWFAHRVQRPHEKINHALVLGGLQGVGKDTLLEPVKHAVGPWNFADVQPGHLLGRFNGFVKSVVIRVSEARDLGDVDRYAFYEHMKIFAASPPDVLRCDEKHLREIAVPTVCGMILTTNHKSDGIYLPADDRRHYVAWCDATKDDFDAAYWTTLYRWYAAGGFEHVAAYLAAFDLSGFDAKAPPPKTAAFFAIVDANRAPEDAAMADVLEACKSPTAITLAMLISAARQEQHGLFADWLADVKSRRQIPHRLEAAGYTPVRNNAAKDGLWKIGGRRQAIYGLTSLTIRDRLAAATALANSKRW